VTKRTTLIAILAPGRGLCLLAKRGLLNAKVLRLARLKKSATDPDHAPGLKNPEEGQDIQDQDLYPGPGPEAEGETDGVIPDPVHDPEALIVAAGADPDIPEAAVDLGQVDMATKGGGVTTEVTADHPCPVAEDILVTGKIQKLANALEYLA